MQSYELLNYILNNRNPFVKHIDWNEELSLNVWLGYSLNMLHENTIVRSLWIEALEESADCAVLQSFFELRR